MGRNKKEEKEEDVVAAFLKQMERSSTVPPTAVQLGNVLVTVLGELDRMKVELEEAKEETGRARSEAKKATEAADKMESRLKVLEDEVKGNSKQNKDLEKKVREKVEENDRRTVVLEKRSIAANLIIRNLELANKNETKDQSIDLANDILATVGLNDLEAEDAYRFKRNPKAKNAKSPLPFS